MDLIQKALQFGYGLALVMVGWIATNALEKLDEIDKRQIVNEREDALRELRISQLERLKQQ
jgi:hypothetical protein